MDTPTTRACGLHAARLTPADYAANFGAPPPPLTPPRPPAPGCLRRQLRRRPSAADPAPGADRGRALLLLPRRAMHHGLPHRDRCPLIHPAHCAGQRPGRGAPHLSSPPPTPPGGIAPRFCPPELLCEQACVRNPHEDKPVAIGGLQRYATDAFFAHPGAPLSRRAAARARRVAVVGAGPAGLACAHGLALRGHAVVLFEARPKLGGLNEYGLASYKTTGDFAQQEVAWLLSVGGIEVRTGQQLGRDMALHDLLPE